MNLSDKLLGPAIRVMESLRFPQKILLLGGIFTLPILFLAYYFVESRLATIDFATKERAGVRAIAPVRGLIQPLQAHRGTAQMALAGSKEAAGKLEGLAAQVDAAFDKGDSLLKALGGQLPVQQEWSALRGEWNLLRNRAGSMTAPESFERHSELIAAALAYIGTVADKSNLTLDPDLDSYYVMDAATVRLPALAELAASTRGKGAGVAQRKTLTVDERIYLSTNLRLFNDNVASLRAGLDKAFGANATVRRALESQLAASQGALDGFGMVMRKDVLEAPAIVVEGAKVFAKGTEAVDGVFKLLDDALPALDEILANRISAVISEMVRVGMLLVLVLASAIYFFVAFRRSVVVGVNTIVAGVDRMARGELGQSLTVSSSDELRTVAQGINGAMERINALIRAQQEMARKHGEGWIDERIDPSGFSGAYAEVARGVNELVQSHIDVKMRVVEVVRQYAEGNLELDIERMPGQRARITQAVDEVKATLLAVNGELMMLVDAAARGDFSARGDVERFKHQFRHMVEGLNRLMGAASAGLDDVGEVLNALARGDLTRTIDAEHAGTFGQLKDDTNTTVGRLREVVGRIKDATDAINTASQEIAAGNSDLSSRTEEQASSLQETASSMEEINATVKQNAENARQAHELVRNSNAVAERGGQMVQKVVATMSEIQHSSSKIADIIGVIDSIAFQTNILALNAAVEAARAGEQGRGFAVVASEVRSLAQRSATAAKEIKSLIAESVDKVEGGAQLVEEAGRTMEEVVSSFQGVVRYVTDIASASKEQSSGIEQVTQAVSQMDEVTQQNAALVEQAAAAAESLEDQARGLTQAVAMFRLEGGGGAAASAQRESARAPVRAAGGGGRNGALPKVRKVANGAPQASAPAGDEWEEF